MNFKISDSCFSGRYLSVYPQTLTYRPYTRTESGKEGQESSFNDSPWKSWLSQIFCGGCYSHLNVGPSLLFLYVKQDNPVSLYSVIFKQRKNLGKSQFMSSVKFI